MAEIMQATEPARSPAGPVREGFGDADGLGSQPALSQWGRVANAYVAPGKTFRDIRRNASWWLPFVLGAIVSILFAASVDRRIGFQQVARANAAQDVQLQHRIDSLPVAQRQKALQSLAVSTRVSSYAYPLTGLAVALIAAALLLASFRVILKARASYRQYLAVWFYAGLPLLLKYVLAAIALFAGAGAATFDIRNPVGTNVGWYLGPGVPEWLRTILYSADIFTIWTVVLLILGCAAIAGVKRRKAAAIVVAWWVLLILSSAASAAFYR